MTNVVDKKATEPRSIPRGVQLAALLGGLLAVGLIFKAALKLNPLRGSGSPLESSYGKMLAPPVELKALYLPATWRQLTPGESGAAPSLTLEHLEGRVAVLNFWASWCESCLQEAPLLEKLWQQYGPQHLTVVGVVLHDDPVKAKEYGLRTGKSYPLAYDSTGRAAIDYGVSGVPETVFLDEEQRVYTKKVGPLDIEELDDIMAALISRNHSD